MGSGLSLEIEDNWPDKQAISTMSHNAQEYYDEMVDEEFDGTYNGIHTLSSVDWIKIKYEKEDLPKKMKKAIKKIYEFEGKIWKGIHNGNLYCKCDSKEKDLKEASRFKIVKVKTFSFREYDWRQKQYKDKTGFNFVIEIVD